jgi:hypothetical protein
LQLFDQLSEQPDHLETRYVLALLLIRRRVLRLEVPVDFSHESPASSSTCGKLEVMHLYCPKRDANYQVAVAVPANDRIDEIQQRLSDWLIAGAD